MLIAATSQPSTQDSVSTTKDSTSGISRVNSTVQPSAGYRRNHTITVGIMIISSYIRPMAYTPLSRAARIFDGGIGMDSSRSLSLAR